MNNKIIKVKARIVFEVEYPVNLEFYDTGANGALDAEHKYVSVNPLEMIELFESKGAFETSVEIVKDEAK